MPAYAEMRTKRSRENIATSGVAAATKSSFGPSSSVSSKTFES